MQIELNGGEREFGTRWRDTGVEQEWYGEIDESGVFWLIQALLINAKKANKSVIYTHSHSDCVSII